jgi:hypothetical protein
MACLNFAGSFFNFDNEGILAITCLYPIYFQSESKMELSCQLDNFFKNFPDDSHCVPNPLCDKEVKKICFKLQIEVKQLHLSLPIHIAASAARQVLACSFSRISVPALIPHPHTLISG